MAFIVNFVTNNSLTHNKPKNNNNNNRRYQFKLVITVAFHQLAGQQMQTHGLTNASQRNGKCKLTG